MTSKDDDSDTINDIDNGKCRMRSFDDLELIRLIFGYFLLNNTFDYLFYLYTTKERNTWFFGTLHLCISKIYKLNI